MLPRMSPILVPTVMGRSGETPDTVAPTVTISTSDGSGDYPISVSIVFSEEVTGFVVGDITASGFTLSNFSTVDNITFTVDALPTTRSCTLDINASVCTDLAGNPNEAATQFTFTSWWFPTDITDADATSLAQLYLLTDGDNWTNKTNWGTNTNVSTWHGITVSGGRVTFISLENNNLNGSVAMWEMPTNLNILYIHSNNLLSGDISGWTIPSTMTNFRIYNTSVSGDISGWTLPSGLTNLYIYNTSVSGDISGWTLPSGLIFLLFDRTLVSGAIADNWTLPANIQFVSIYNTSVSGDASNWVIPATVTYWRSDNTSLTNYPDPSGAVAMTTFNYKNNGLSQANVDGLLWSLYQITRTASNGTIDVSGTNAAPSGTFQAAASCPVTGSTPGKEIAHELLNDGCGAGINTWATVTFTA